MDTVLYSYGRLLQRERENVRMTHHLTLFVGRPTAGQRMMVDLGEKLCHPLFNYALTKHTRKSMPFGDIVLTEK